MGDLLARLQAALGDTYRIEKELGGGGMSRLYLATEASLHRQVVIKLLPPEFTSEVSAARFKQEIELAAHLQHPNILPVLTAGAKDDLLFYVMPFVPGESLRHRLTREGRLPVADAVRILHEIADALAQAHAEGVIHRDIKPENILLLGSHAVLTDFGVARALAESRSGGRLTDTGLALGTPGYMSPEQAAGERHVDARADVYALAVVGYEMLAGQPPFAGPTAQAVIAAHLTATPKPLADVRPESPPAVCNAIARALAKDPNARLRTAAEFRVVLGEMLRAGPESVRVAARIIDANTKRLVGEIEVRQDAARMDRLVDSLTLGLLGALARAQPTGVARPTSWGAAPLPAVKAFLQGAQFYRRAAWDSALTSFGRALAIDSGFALALRGMRQVTWWGGVPSVSEAASREYALRAGTFNHGLAPRESLLIAAESLEAAVDAGALTDSGWWSHTRRYFSTMEEARARYPDDPDVWYQLGEARFHFGWFMGIPEVKAREAFDKAIALDSEFAPAYLHAFQLGLEQGGRAAAEHYLKSYLALKPSGAIGEAAGVLLLLLDPLTSRAAADSLLDTVARTRGPLGSVWYDVKRWPDSGETSVRLDSLIRQVGPKSGSDAAILERLYARDLAYRGHLHRAAEVAGSRVPGVLA